MPLEIPDIVGISLSAVRAVDAGGAQPPKIIEERQAFLILATEQPKAVLRLDRLHVFHSPLISHTITLGGRKG